MRFRRRSFRRGRGRYPRRRRSGGRRGVRRLRIGYRM